MPESIIGQQILSKEYYEAYEVDTMPRLLINDSIVNLENVIFQNMNWINGMNEGEKVVSSFIIDTSGYIVCIDLYEIPAHCELCLKEFIRCITSLPRFQPGKKNNQAVNVKITQIFHFNIQR